ncbi:MAG: hypothetical protein ACOY3L_15260 [Pseudomonadota bacterium]
MFSLPSLSKLLVLVAVIVLVWQGFKMLGRLQRARQAEAEARLRQAQAQARAAQQRRSAGAVEETRQCRVCGAYVAKGMGACGRPDCPFGA